MLNHHQKLTLYQLLLLFCVDLPPQGMKLTPDLIILLFKFLSVILPAIINHKIIPPPQGLGLSIPSTIPPPYPLIYPQQNTKHKI